MVETVISGDVVAYANLRPSCQHTDIIWNICKESPSVEPAIACARDLSLRINQYDDKMFILNLKDQDGNDLLVSDVTDIIFSVSRRINTIPIIKKTKSLYEVIYNDLNSVFVILSSTESGSLDPGINYCEIRGKNPDSTYQTMGSGIFTVCDTNIGENTP